MSAAVGNVTGLALSFVVGRVVNLPVLRFMAALALGLLVRFQFKRRRASLAQVAVLTLSLHYRLMDGPAHHALIPAAVRVVTLNAGLFYLIAEMDLLEPARVVMTGEAKSRRLFL